MRHLQVQLHDLAGQLSVFGSDGECQVSVVGQALLHVCAFVQVERTGDHRHVDHGRQHMDDAGLPQA